MPSLTLLSSSYHRLSGFTRPMILKDTDAILADPARPTPA
jgi:hypothetical protein